MPLLIGGSYRADQISLSDAPIGDYFFEVGMTTYEYLSVLVSSTTNVTITVQATNDDVVWHDITTELFGVAALAVDAYIPDHYIAVKNIRFRCTVTNALNKLYIEWLAKKGGGR